MLINRESSHKFGHDLVTELLWERTLDSGQDHTTGESDSPDGWNALFLFDESDEMRVYTMAHASIVGTDSVGFVYRTDFASHADALSVFDALEAAYSMWLNDDDDYADDDTDPIVGVPTQGDVLLSYDCTAAFCNGETIVRVGLSDSRLDTSDLRNLLLDGVRAWCAAENYFPDVWEDYGNGNWHMVEMSV